MTACQVHSSLPSGHSGQAAAYTAGQVSPAGEVFVRLVGLHEAVKHLGRPGANKHSCHGGVPAGAGQVGEQGAQEGVVWVLVPGFGLFLAFN